MTIPERKRQQVFEEKGHECIVCGRTMDERIQGLSIHHVNGDGDDNRLENLIPVCQSCHVSIHRLDEPPYRRYHRQLPLEYRNRLNQHTSRIYEGERLTADEAERLHEDGEETHRSKQYTD